MRQNILLSDYNGDPIIKGYFSDLTTSMQEISHENFENTFFKYSENGINLVSITFK